MNQNLFRKQKAQTLVEFALILPLLLVMAFFILDFGRAVYYFSALYNGAREGARYGTTLVYITDTLDAGDQALIAVQAKKHLYGIPAASVTVTSSIIDTGFKTKRYLNVTTQYTYTPVTPFLSIVIPAGITLRSNSSMRIEPRVDMD